MFFQQMFQSPDGDISSKRVLAALLIVSGIAYMFVSLIQGRPDAAGAGVLIGGGTGTLTAMAITKS